MKQATTMYIFLPRNSTPDNLIKLQSQLTATKVENIINNMKVRKISVWFPRFKLTDSFSLKDNFERLGLRKLFDQNYCDLSLMTQEKSFKGKRQANGQTAAERLDFLRKLNEIANARFWVSKIIHKIYLSVDEIGTEGAAVTVAIEDRAYLKVPEVRVDVPFMMLIRHDPTKTPLFYGLVFDPTSGVDV